MQEVSNSFGVVIFDKFSPWGSSSPLLSLLVVIYLNLLIGISVPNLRKATESIVNKKTSKCINKKILGIFT